MKSTSVNTSSAVTLLDNNVKDADLASIYKELTKNLELINFTGDHLKVTSVKKNDNFSKCVT